MNQKTQAIFAFTVIAVVAMWKYGADAMGIVTAVLTGIAALTDMKMDE